MPDKLYLDTCIVSRPLDDQSQPRVRAEASAVAAILDLVASGEVVWVASAVVYFEVSRNPNTRNRQDTLDLLQMATETALIDPPTAAHAVLLQQRGFGVFDAFHLALAQAASATALLTVDDRFIQRAALRSDNSSLPVENPIDWLRRRRPWLIKR